MQLYIYLGATEEEERTALSAPLHQAHGGMSKSLNENQKFIFKHSPIAAG